MQFVQDFGSSVPSLRMTAADPSHNRGQTNGNFVTPTSATPQPHEIQKTPIKKKMKNMGVKKKLVVHGQCMGNVPMK